MKKNEKCALCLCAMPDKTGSHLITHSLMASALNFPGKKGRDNNLAFSAGSKSALSLEYYRGRSIIESNLEDVIQLENYKEVSDDPFINDYVFCKSCEEKFNHIETPFIQNVYQKLSKGELILNPYLIQLTKMMILINLFRLSVGKFPFHLKPKFEEKIRRLLKDQLQNTSRETNEKLKYEENKTLKDIPIILNYHKLSEDSYERTKSVIFLHPNVQIPYFGIINNLVVRVYEKLSQLKGSPSVSLFEFETGVNSSKNHLNSLTKTGFSLGEISRSKMTNVIRNIGNFHFSNVIYKWKNFIVKSHYECFKFRIHDNTLHHLLKGVIEILNKEKADDDDVLRYITRAYLSLMDGRPDQM